MKTAEELILMGWLNDQDPFLEQLPTNATFSYKEVLSIVKYASQFKPSKEEKTGGEVEESKKCVAGCMRYDGGEVKHHKDCVYYPESLSKMYDDLLSQSTPLTEDNYEVEADEPNKLIDKHFIKNKVYLTSNERHTIIDIIKEASKMSLSNKNSAEIGWDACEARKDYESRIEWYKYHNLSTPPDKKTFLNSLPETEDKMGKLIEFIKSKSSIRGMEYADGWSAAMKLILEKAKEINSRK